MKCNTTECVPGTDVTIAVRVDADGIVVTVSKAGLALYELFLADVQKDFSKEELLSVAQHPAEGYFSIERALESLKRVEREVRKIRERMRSDGHSE